MKTSDEIRRIADEMEAVLNTHDLAAPNPGAVSRLRFLAAQMSGLDTYCAEKAGKIAHAAEKFYSARKYATHPGGADQLYTDMRIDLLGRIRSQAATRAMKGD